MSVPWSLEEYEDPLLYDVENNGTAELPFLRDWAGKIQVGDRPIMDLGCGTGRLTLPMAEAGYTMIGIDVHEGMLERAKEKTKPGLSVSWLRQDCRALDVPMKSPLVYMVGHVFQHFLTNQHQEELLKSVHSVLAPNGTFIFNTRFPSADELLQPAEEQYDHTIVDHNNRNVQIFYKMEYDPINQIQHYKTIRRFYDQDELQEERVTTIDLRYTYPQEIEKTLALNGFTLLHLFDGWEEKALNPDCYSIVVVCQKVD
ncbi:class I SAM-dependent methyltransferase [Brevibacillus sp. 179-C8.2 HS]